MNKLLSVPLLALLVLGSLVTFAQPADVILTNGKIFTADPAGLYVQALAIRGNKILAVGNNAAIEKLASARTGRIDLGGKTVVPGFNDAHYHHGAPYRGRHIGFSPDGMASPGRPVLADSISQLTKALPKGTWIHAILGPGTINDTTLNRFALDKLAPDHPVRLAAFWGHVSVFNTAALKYLGILDKHPQSKAGYFERVPDGRTINGRMYDNAQPSLEGLVEETSFVTSLRQLGQEALGYGVTTVQNMCTFATPDVYASMWQKAGLPIRFRAIRWADMEPDGKLIVPSAKSSLHPPGLPLMTISGTKWMVEGTPVEKNAFFKAGYLQPEGWHGIVYYSSEDIRQMIREGMARQDQVMFHLSGDSTIRMVAAALRQIPGEEAKKMRVRIEHGTVVTPDLVQPFKAAGAVVVVNPVHPLLDTAVHFLKDGADRDLDPVKSLLTAGLPVAIGSDGPLNPFLNIMLAMIRPEESLSCEEAVIAYTRTAAYAERLEREKGTLQPGMLADLAVLSQDIFTIPPPELPKTVSVLTIVDGKIAYQSPAAGRKGR
jgi:predicted amidohydrolase YtcJ